MNLEGYYIKVESTFSRVMYIVQYSDAVRVILDHNFVREKPFEFDIVKSLGKDIRRLQISADQNARGKYYITMYRAINGIVGAHDNGVLPEELERLIRTEFMPSEDFRDIINGLIEHTKAEIKPLSLLPIVEFEKFLAQM